MLRQASFSIALLAAAVAGPAFGQDARIQLKFKEGEKFYVEDVNKSKETISLAGNMLSTETKVTSVTSFAVKKVNADTTVVDMKIESVDIQTNEETGMLGKVMKKMKGANFTVTLAPDGKVKKFDGYKEWAKSVVGEDEDQTKLLMAFVSEDLFVNMVEQGFTFLPPSDQTVKKGDTWSNESKIPFSMMGDFKSKNTYTYEGKDKDLDIIAVKRAMKYSPPKAGTEILGGLFKLNRAELKADNVRGKYFFDSAKGRPEKVEMSTTISGTLTVDIGGQQQQIELSVVSHGASRVLDKSPTKD